jgi:hypothetical protein
MKINLWNASNTKPEESNIYREYFLNMSYKTRKVKNFLMGKTSIWKILETLVFPLLPRGLPWGIMEKSTGKGGMGVWKFVYWQWEMW